MVPLFLLRNEIIDGYYAKVQEMGGNRWDSSGLIALLKKKK